MRTSQIEAQIIGFKLEGLSHAEIASRCKMNARTLQRLIAVPAFKAKYEAAKSVALESVVDGIRAAGLIGVKALREIAASRDSAPTARVAAARSILEILLRATEISVMVQRLDKLEAAFKGDQ
jgi:hypothetical protein